MAWPLHICWRVKYLFLHCLYTAASASKTDLTIDLACGSHNAQRREVNLANSSSHGAARLRPMNDNRVPAILEIGERYLHCVSHAINLAAA